MPDPRVSIIMLTYNRPQLIGRAIQSVVEQDFPSWELLVVQDGGNPHTFQVMDGWTKRDPRIQHLHRSRGGNIADATNYGIRRSRGAYIAILDDDDYWARPDKLTMQVRFLDEHPDYAGCGGGIDVLDPSGAVRLRNLKPQSHEQIQRRALYANPMAHSTVVYRREALERCGLYDVSLPGFQDWDVCLKLGKLGKLFNFPEVLTCYQLWEGGGSFHAQRANTQAAVRIVRRHRHGYGGFPVAFPMACAYYAYARLPESWRRVSYQFLSRMKKSLFGTRTAL